MTCLGMLAIWESDELTTISEYFNNRLPEDIQVQLLESTANNDNVSVKDTTASSTDKTNGDDNHNKVKKDSKKNKSKTSSTSTTLSTQSANTATDIGMDIDESLPKSQIRTDNDSAATGVTSNDESWMDSNNLNNKKASADKSKKKKNKK